MSRIQLLVNQVILGAAPEVDFLMGITYFGCFVFSCMFDPFSICSESCWAWFVL